MHPPFFFSIAVEDIFLGVCFKLLEMSAEKRTPKSSLHCYLWICCFGCLCLEHWVHCSVVTNNAAGIKCQILRLIYMCVFLNA